MTWTVSERDGIYFLTITTEEKWIYYAVLNDYTLRIGDDIIEIPPFLPEHQKGVVYSRYDSQDKFNIHVVYIPFSAGNMPKIIAQSK